MADREVCWGRMCANTASKRARMVRLSSRLSTIARCKSVIYALTDGRKARSLFV
jgi:hypothetical protein